MGHILCVPTVHPIAPVDPTIEACIIGRIPLFFRHPVVPFSFYEKRFFKPRHLNKLLVSDMHNSGKDAFSAVALTRGAVSADRLCTVHTAAAVYSLHCIGKHRRQEPELIHSFLPSSSLHRISALGTPWTQLELDQDIPTMCGVGARTKLPLIVTSPAKFTVKEGKFINMKGNFVNIGGQNFPSWYNPSP